MKNANYKDNLMSLLTIKIWRKCSNNDRCIHISIII